jgi:hypothetical protein
VSVFKYADAHACPGKILASRSESLFQVSQAILPWFLVWEPLELFYLRPWQLGIGISMYLGKNVSVHNRSATWRNMASCHGQRKGAWPCQESLSPFSMRKKPLLQVSSVYKRYTHQTSHPVSSDPCLSCSCCNKSSSCHLPSCVLTPPQIQPLSHVPLAFPVSPTPPLLWSLHPFQPNILCPLLHFLDSASVSTKGTIYSLFLQTCQTQDKWHSVICGCPQNPESTVGKKINLSLSLYLLYGWTLDAPQRSCVDGLVPSWWCWWEVAGPFRGRPSGRKLSPCV